MDAITRARRWRALPAAFKFQLVCLAPFAVTRAAATMRSLFVTVAYADSICDFEAHLAGGAGDDAEGGFVVVRVEVFALRVHDVHDLFARDFPTLVLLGSFEPAAMFAAFFNRTAAGGLLVMNVNDLSL